MTDSRSQILSTLHRALHRGRGQAHDLASTHPPAAPRPALDADRLRAFRMRAEAAAATVAVAGTPMEAVDDVVGYLTHQDLPPEALVAPHPLLASLSWPDGMVPRTRAAGTDDPVGVTVPFAGVAETGSLALLSGPETPMTLNFLPDHLICVLPATRIVAHLEDLWALLRTERVLLPRALTLVTGPSRTADVEQTIQMGAHGPRRLHIVLIGQ